MIKISPTLLFIFDFFLILLWIINPIRLVRAVKYKSKYLKVYTEFKTGKALRFHIAIILIIAFLVSSIVQSNCYLIIMFGSEICPYCEGQTRLFKEKFEGINVVIRDIYSDQVYMKTFKKIYDTLGFHNYMIPLTIVIRNSKIIAVVNRAHNLTCWNNILYKEGEKYVLLDSIEYCILDKNIIDEIYYNSLLVRISDDYYVFTLIILILLLTSVIYFKILTQNTRLIHYFTVINIYSFIFLLITTLLLNYFTINYISLGIFTLFSISIIVTASVYRLPVSNNSKLKFTYILILLFNYVLYTRNISTQVAILIAFIIINSSLLVMKIMGRRRIIYINKILEVSELISGLIIIDLAIMMYY